MAEVSGVSAERAPSAVWALVLGLVALIWCGFIAGIPAIIMGNRTMREIEGSGGALGGRGMARFGQIAGWLTVLVYPVIAVIAIIVVTVGNN